MAMGSIRRREGERERERDREERERCHVPVNMHNHPDSEWGRRKALTSCRAAVMWPDVDRLSADTMHKPMSDGQITWEGKHRERPRG